MTKFVGTKYKCLTCGTILQSKYEGDWVSCPCKNFVDQTEYYVRVGGISKLKKVDDER